MLLCRFDIPVLCLDFGHLSRDFFVLACFLSIVKTDCTCSVMVEFVMVLMLNK